MLVLLKQLDHNIRDHGRRGFPHEICGLLLGRFHADGHREAVETFELENERVDSRETRYSVSGRSMLEAERYARRAGLEIIGYYHSHPDAPARPSAYDLDHATWPGISYPIVSVVNGVPEDLRSYTLADDRSQFVEEPVRVQTDDCGTHSRRNPAGATCE